MDRQPDTTGHPGRLPVKEAVSFAVHRPGEGEEGEPWVLAVLRPPDDHELPGVWGLPATSLREGESWEEALVRAGRQKLGVTLRPGSLLAEGKQERPLEDPTSEEAPAPHLLRMRVYEATIQEGSPTVQSPRGSGTHYADWRWADPEELREAARRGSLCTSLYLEATRPEA